MSPERALILAEPLFRSVRDALVGVELQLFHGRLQQLENIGLTKVVRTATQLARHGVLPQQLSLNDLVTNMQAASSGFDLYLPGSPGPTRHVGESLVQNLQR